MMLFENMPTPRDALCSVRRALLGDEELSRLDLLRASEPRMRAMENWDHLHFCDLLLAIFARRRRAESLCDDLERHPSGEVANTVAEGLRRDLEQQDE